MPRIEKEVVYSAGLLQGRERRCCRSTHGHARTWTIRPVKGTGKQKKYGL
ncbi:MAG: hypothetical protein KAW12_14165 [Candidatus Aminicenantes bacterium]|nr:hypothetical protein [Candidatus Aminicenantes bacterium]